MLLNQGYLDDKVVLNQRAMQFPPSNDFAYCLTSPGNVDGMRAQRDLAVANYANDRGEALKVVRELEKSGEAGMQELLCHAQ